MNRKVEMDQTEKSLYVLLTQTGTWFGELIKRFTAAPYNHASLALDAELNEVFSFGRKQAANPWVAGFVREDLYTGAFRHFPDTRCVLLRLRISARQYASVLRTIQFFQENNAAYRYNLVGLLGVLLQRGIEPDNAYFCSQFVAHTLLSSGIPLWEQPASLVTPNDFFHHPALEVVYEGRLYDYPLLDRKRLAIHQHTGDFAFHLRDKLWDRADLAAYIEGNAEPGLHDRQGKNGGGVRTHRKLYGKARFRLG